jgi:hypothetical protein
MHARPAGDNFCDEHGNGMKPAIVADCNMHIGYVDEAHRMTNSYSLDLEMDKETRMSTFSAFINDD